MVELNRLLRPRSIAAVGGSTAATVIRQCQKMGFDGDIWPVHPSKAEVEGLAAFRSIGDLPTAPDATFIGVNRHLTLEIVKALAARGAGGAVCYASGFLEADEEGANLQSELLALAGQMPILGPNCYGVINYADGALLWPDQHGGRRLAEGESGVAIIMQSSNIAINLTMQRRGLPIAYMLTAGNQAMVGLSDLAMAVLEDPRVSCLGLHIEGFDSVRGMEALARMARRLNKPVIALKVGKSEQAQQATLSHTASLAGTHATSQAFLKRLGIGQVETLPAFLETLKLLQVHGTLAGYRLGSMSCSGGEASIVADAAQSKKVHFPTLLPDEKQAVQQALGSMVTVNNPLDYHTYIWADLPKMQSAYASMLAADHDLTLLVLDFPKEGQCRSDDWDIALTAFEAAVNEVSDVRAGAAVKAVVTVSLPENIPELVIEALMKKGIVAIGGVDETLVAAEVAADIGQAWGKPEPVAIMDQTSVMGRGGKSETVICRSSNNDEDQGVIGAQRLSQYVVVTLDEATAKAKLSQFSVPVPEGKVVAGLDEVLAAADEMTYPLVLKALGIAHKTEQNAVRLNIQGEAELVQTFTELNQLSGQCYLEAMIRNPIAELIVGISHDQQFGLVMTIGAGGILVELIKDTATLLLPASQEDISDALNGLKTAPLLNGFRGKPAADISAAIEAILATQQFALDHADTLQELDINPLILCEQGQGVYAADALVVLNQGDSYV